MCDTPLTYKEAIDAYDELDSNFRRYKTSMENAEKKLKAARKIIEEHEGADPFDKFDIILPNSKLLTVSAARKMRHLNNRAVFDYLQDMDADLPPQLATFTLTKVKPYIAEIPLNSMSEIVPGSRTFKVK